MQMAKRMAAVLSLLAVLLVGTACYAAIAGDGIAIGGIYYHAPASYVTDIYGAPARTVSTAAHPLWKGQVDTYYYGDSLQVVLCDGQVVHVTSKNNNGLGTPAGAAVGMTEAALMDLYGAGEAVTDKAGVVIAHYYGSEADASVGLKASVRDGIVTELSAGAFD